MLHNFTKYFSGAQVNQIVNKDLKGESTCLSNLSFSASKKCDLKNFYSKKEWMMLEENIDKNAFEIIAMPNNLVLTAGFKIRMFLKL